ncbi:nardilysin-like isoform 2-T5 [Syngnathus typhle]
MPQTSKSVSTGNASGQACALDEGEPPPTRDLGTSQDSAEDPEDPEIIKSPSDPKKYRYLRLTNGLRALLISDLSAADGKTEDAGADEDDKDDEDVADSGEGSDEDDEDDEEEEKDSDFEELDEDNGAKKKKSSEKQAAAALCIGVGSFSDPDELPGLAHFLEHMVFMGSRKYPAENGFDAFLKKHGGSDNASTDCERTVFQFDVQKKHFREALDRWAQFFICPLMIEDAVDREVEAVDSEYQLAKPSDSHRKEMLFGSLAVPGHPMSKFCWGNAQTLKHDPKERGVNTYQCLRQFWARFYSAHYMTLAVQSKETLDTLEQWVREIFIHIPNNAEPAVDFSHLPRPFDTPAFNKLYRVVPVRKVHALTISWALPPQGQHYRVKPLHYISWLIGHEGSGSILSMLRKKCWALALFGGNSETGFDQNTTYSIFSISITLTDQGFCYFWQVVHLVFQYLKMLQTLGPQQRIYEEIQKIEDNEFHYQEQTDPIEFVENICENMQLFPKEDFLTGDQLMFHFDTEVIGAALSSLTPERANLLLLSPEHEGHCQLREKWFGTSYTVEDIPAEWAQRWASDFELNPELHLPAENKFIGVSFKNKKATHLCICVTPLLIYFFSSLPSSASDFTLRPSDCLDSEFPVKILDNQLGCLWYKKDNKFNIPKAYIRFHLISPVIQKSSENLVLFDLFVNILAHNLAEPAYEADVAQLEYKLVAGEHGLVVRLKGFNHKLPLLLKLLVEHLAEFTSCEGVFAMFLEQLKKTYFNILIKPERLGKDVRLLILEQGRWSLVEKYRAAVAGLSLQDLLDFAGQLKAELYVEGLVQGNFTGTESKEFLHYFTEQLHFRPLPAEVPVSFRVAELPVAHHLCKVKSLNKGDANSEVTVYYQSGLKKLREHTLMELLVMHMEEPCFDFLRTKETLGYHVYATCRNTSGVLGFSVTVETQATKFSTEFVEAKVEEFLHSFGERLRALTEEAFSTQVTALIKLKECEDAHLGEEVDRNWFEVLTRQFLFQRLNMEISALKDLTREDLLSWFAKHRDSARKLSVHVVGFGTEEGNPPRPEPDLACDLEAPASAATSSYGEVSSLNFLPLFSPALRDSATPICDIRAFASALPLHPYHKVLS